METLPGPRLTTILPPPLHKDPWAAVDQFCEQEEDDFGGFDPEQWITDARPTDIDELCKPTTAA